MVRRFWGYAVVAVAVLVALTYTLAKLGDDPTARVPARASVGRPPPAAPVTGSSETVDAPATLAAAIAPVVDDTSLTATGPAPEAIFESEPEGPARPAPAAEPTEELVAQLGPAVALAVGSLQLLQPINAQLPPLPALPFVAVPSLPPSAAPLQDALAPAVGPACGNLGTVYVLLAVLNLPIPVTSQHFGVAFSEVFAACAALTPS